MSEIPIENIYYLLSYAYSKLKIDKDVLKEAKEYDNIQDLFARILINSLNSLIKSGFYRSYITKNDDLFAPKGKINISSSIKRRTLVKKQVNCSYDEFSSDVLFNQIIKSTIYYLTGLKQLDNALSKKLQGFKPYFQDIMLIKITKDSFKALRWDKNNQDYYLIMSICELIYSFRLPEEKLEGDVHFKDFIEDNERAMAHLFENFVYNFFKKELTEIKEIRVYKPHIKWNINEKLSTGIEHLPEMKTDIILETTSKQMIIDTKFYKEIMPGGLEKGTIDIGNLYQIFSYISNSRFCGEISGMLLYASTGIDLDFKYQFMDKVIYIKTINLAQNWRDIDWDLREIADLLKN